ncbi:MFS transporter [Yinghuangia aomiensis]
MANSTTVLPCRTVPRSRPETAPPRPGGAPSPSFSSALSSPSSTRSSSTSRLADIGKDLHASEAQLELTVSGHGVAYACTLVAGGRLGDRFGRRRLFLTGLVGFTVTSAACGLAPNVSSLVVFRILQGLTAALMSPQVLAAIQAGFDGADRQRAVGIFGLVAGSAGAIGQIAGGLLLQADLFGTGWRPLFLVNVPIGITRVPPRGSASRRRPRAPVAARIDIRGALALAATIALLLIPLTLGRAEDWPGLDLVALALVLPAARPPSRSPKAGWNARAAHLCSRRRCCGSRPPAWRSAPC